MTTPQKGRWDAELYEAQHSFVWRFGAELLELLKPTTGERILDVGCGTGQLTAEIARSGAEVVGVDSSVDMIGQARQNFPSASHPNLQFTLADAGTMQFNQEFDAVFSNAALHWMLDTAAVSDAMYRALKPRGRLVLECGGKGNIRQIESAIHQVLRELGRDVPPSRTVFHSIGSLAEILESSGFDVLSALLFDRPTQLEGERGMERWLEQFAAYYFEHWPAAQRSEAFTGILARLRPMLFRDGQWYADYRRLRVTARKPAS